MVKICSVAGCGCVLGKANKSGLCGPHWNQQYLKKYNREKQAWRRNWDQKLAKQNERRQALIPKCKVCGKNLRSREGRPTSGLCHLHGEHRERYQKKHVHLTRLYRARKSEAGGQVSAAEWAAVLESFGHRCAWCASTGDLAMDHIHPVSKGGATVIQNVQPLCRSCNSSKGGRVLGYRP